VLEVTVTLYVVVVLEFRAVPCTVSLEPDTA